MSDNPLAADCPPARSLEDFLQRLCGRRDEDDPIDQQADELIEDFWRLRRDLDAMLTPEVRHDLLELLRAADARRAETAASMIAWVNLVEEICLAVEVDYGDGTGPAKLQRVRSVIFQLTRAFLGDAPFQSLPAFVRPFVIDLVCRGTVEFVIQLVNTRDSDRSLWRTALPAGVTPQKSQLVRTGARVAAKRWTLYERIAGWLLRPGRLPAALQARVDAIIARWDAETERAGSPPVQRVVQSMFIMLEWVGHHGPEVRRAIDALSITTHWAFEFADLNDAERISLIKRALSRYLDELGLGGSLFKRLCDLAIEFAVDAAVDLLRKRRAFAQPASESTSTVSR